MRCNYDCSRAFGNRLPDYWKGTSYEEILFIRFLRSLVASRWLLAFAQDSRLSHHFVAFAQEGWDVEIVGLKVPCHIGEHAAAHGVHGNHFRDRFGLHH